VSLIPVRWPCIILSVAVRQSICIYCLTSLRISVCRRRRRVSRIAQTIPNTLLYLDWARWPSLRSTSVCRGRRRVFRIAQSISSSWRDWGGRGLLWTHFLYDFQAKCSKIILYFFFLDIWFNWRHIFIINLVVTRWNVEEI
jgi:hypothetical protein